VVLTIDGFLDAAACRRIRAAMDRGAVEPAEILADAITLDAEVRRAAFVDVDAATLADVERRLDARRDEIAQEFGTSLSGREGAAFLRYGPGGFYLPHVDRAFSDAWPDASRRQIAVVVFLNADLAGGELALLDDGVEVAPRAGQLVAFDAGMLHEVRPVREGTRDVIVDWFS
jgi:predicted 2-oxoglutarate/Fe(II)-dependent dioxygenase YbiX